MRQHLPLHSEMPMSRQLKKMVVSLIRRLPGGTYIAPRKIKIPMEEVTVFPFHDRTVIANLLNRALTGGLSYNSYKDLLKEGQEMQLKTTMNLMTIMESLQSNLIINDDPIEHDPQLVEDAIKVCASIHQSCTTVLGSVIPPLDRAACYRELDIGCMIRRLRANPSIIDRSRRQNHEEVVWNARYNPDHGILLYNGQRIVRNETSKPMEYYYNFSFQAPFPLAHERMMVTLTNLVNCFRSDFDCGPWQRASSQQIREIEAILSDTDCIPPEPAPSSCSSTRQI